MLSDESSNDSHCFCYRYQAICHGRTGAFSEILLDRNFFLLVCQPPLSWRPNILKRNSTEFFSSSISWDRPPSMHNSDSPIVTINVLERFGRWRTSACCSATFIVKMLRPDHSINPKRRSSVQSPFREVVSCQRCIYSSGSTRRDLKDQQFFSRGWRGHRFNCGCLTLLSTVKPFLKTVLPRNSTLSFTKEHLLRLAYSLSCPSTQNTAHKCVVRSSFFCCKNADVIKVANHEVKLVKQHRHIAWPHIRHTANPMAANHH